MPTIFNSTNELIRACARFFYATGRIGHIDEVIAFELGRRYASR